MTAASTSVRLQGCRIRSSLSALEAVCILPSLRSGREHVARTSPGRGGPRFEEPSKPSTSFGSSMNTAYSIPSLIDLAPRGGTAPDLTHSETARRERPGGRWRQGIVRNRLQGLAR